MKGRDNVFGVSGGGESILSTDVKGGLAHDRKILSETEKKN